MSDNLKKWLVEDVGMEVSQLEKDFASGYAFGDLLDRFDLLKDFEKFEQQRTPDAMINNYTRLQSSTRKLGITLDSRTANSLMREEPGVALRMLYAIKQAVEERVSGGKPTAVRKDSASRASGTMDGNGTASRPGPQDNRQQTEPIPGRRFFTEAMPRLNGTKNEMMETMHLRRYSEKQYKYESAAEAKVQAEHMQAEQQAATFRSTVLKQMGSARQGKVKRLERDEKIHAALLKRKDEVEKEELRVELALSEKARRKRLEELSHASLDVHRGIDAFEINMKRLVKTDDDSERALAPATTHNPMEHMIHLRGMAPATSRLLEDSSSYIQSVQAQRLDDIATKKEREARRRKMTVEQQQEAALAEVKAQEEAFIAFLNQQSVEEQQMAERLWLQREEEEKQRLMRLEREAEYAEKRNQEWEEALRVGVVHHQTMRETYHAQAAAEKARWKTEMDAQDAELAAEHAAVCRDVAWQVVMLAERLIEHRETQGGVVPLNKYRKWVSMFVEGDPQLGDPVVLVDEDAERDAYLQDPAVRTQMLDYLECVGDFAPAASSDTAPGIREAIGTNHALAQVLVDLTDQVRDKVLLEDLPSNSYPLRLAVVGAPLSGKTTAAADLSKRFKLRVITPQAVMADAVKLAEGYEARTAEWVTKQEAEAAAAAKAAADAAAAAGEGGGEAPAEPPAPPPLEPPPPPSTKEALGLAVLKASRSGELVDDEVLAKLMVMAMEETKDWTPPKEPDPKGVKAAKPAKGAPPPTPDPPQGFVLDGFPSSMAQARFMEQQLTGLDLEEEQAMCDAASLVAPPPPGSLPIVDRPLTSGLDVVFVMGLADEVTALQRATGRKLDPQTGRVYHTTYDPAPATDTALVARLEEDEADAKATPVCIRRKFKIYQEEAGPLDSWLKRFQRLRHPVDTSASLSEVLESTAYGASAILNAAQVVSVTGTTRELAAKAQEDAQEAKALSEQADLNTEATARELLASKQLEMAALGTITDPKNPPAAAAEIGKFNAGQKCAEQLRACKAAAIEAASLAEQAATAAEQAKEAEQRSREASDAELLQQADKDTRAAAEAAAAARQGATEAAGKAQEALKAAQAAVKVITDLQNPPAAAKDGTAPAAEGAAAEGEEQGDSVCAKDTGSQPAEAVLIPIPKDACASLLEKWRAIEKKYTESLASNFAHLLAERTNVDAHFTEQKASFQSMLSKPDERPAIVAKFQEAFNDVPNEKRSIKEIKAGMLMRAEDLREMLWEVTDRKMKMAAAERMRLKGDSFVADHTAVAAHHFLKLLQVEVDRCFSSINFSVDYSYAKFGVAEQCKRRWPLEKPNVIRGKASESQMEALNSLQSPQVIAMIEEHSPQLYQALRMSLAAAECVATTMSGPPEELPVASPADHSPAGRVEGAVAVSRRGDDASEEGDEASGEAEGAGEGEGYVAAEDEAAAAGEDPVEGGTGDREGGLESVEAAAYEEATTVRVLDEATLAAVASIVAEVGTRESSILKQRVLLIAQRAMAVIQDLLASAQEADKALAECIKERYQAECSAAWAVDHTVKAAAREERAIEEVLAFMVDDSLQLDVGAPVLEGESSALSEPVAGGSERKAGTVLTFASSARLVLTPGGPQAHVRKPPSCVLSTDQLGSVVKRLALTCPGGFLQREAAAQLLYTCIQDGTFPDMWAGTSMEALQSMLTHYDHLDNGWVDWREIVCHLISAAFPVITAAECSDMADQVEMLSEADADKDGMVTEEQWESVELWFQYRQFRPGQSASRAEADEQGPAYDKNNPETLAQAERTTALKRVLWSMFSSSSLPNESPAAMVVSAMEDGLPRMDFRAALLYLCADKDVYQGIKKAGSVAAGSISANARLTPRELNLMAYPLGIHEAEKVERAPYDRAEIAEKMLHMCVARGADPQAAPELSVEQLIYSAQGETIISSILQHYKLKDAFVACKLGAPRAS